MFKRLARLAERIWDRVLVQALAAGQLGSLAEGRALIRQSFPVQTFERRPSTAWDTAYQRYLHLKS